MGKKEKRHGHCGPQGPVQPPPPTPIYRKKKGTPGWIKALGAILFIGVIGAVAVWQFYITLPPVPTPTSTPTPTPKPTPTPTPTSTPAPTPTPTITPSPSPSPTPIPPQAYPTYATGVFYNNPTVTGSGTKIQLPYSFVKDKKIVFVDAKLANETNELQYQGRIIPLNLYKGGNYLPLIVLYTPSGNVKVGIRTCEPCGSFSMHIGEGKYLICDACGTKWDLETFKGISGGCPEYPPPQLPVTIGNNIEVDLSTLGVTAVG